MDVYHKVLAKLCDVTGGKSAQSVDLRDLVKKMEFHGNYTDIYTYLCREGWVAEDTKSNFVKITHWGIAEVKKTEQASNRASDEPSIEPQTFETVKKLVKELNTLTEKLSPNSPGEEKDKVRAKFGELEKSIKNIFG